MQTYEFYTTPEDGIIRIPEQYRHKINSNIKVIILEETPWKFNRAEENAQHKSDLLLSPTMNTKNWKFNREAANER